ncbi:hypothetical protein [Alkalihalobacillus sp. 1P02AB]|uniref:hypothetical protein n=1 Tax=Alkalihalobacillus sp. 1P02AB TaxID=3132260 RepID=UPI0039A5B03F
MKKSILLIILIFGLLTSVVNQVKAITNEETRPLEEVYPEIGYKTIEESVQEFEQYFNKELKLPLRVPPLNFTHQFGRFTKTVGDKNGALNMEFINEESPELHYTIDVRPVVHKIRIKDEHIIKLYNLKNGNKATYMDVSESVKVFVFERDNWQYMLWVDHRVSDIVTPELFVKIADSIDFPNEKEDPLE